MVLFADDSESGRSRRGKSAEMYRTLARFLAKIWRTSGYDTAHLKSKIFRIGYRVLATSFCLI